LRRWHRVIDYAPALALVGALMAAALTGIGLAFDGSYIWFSAIETGQPFIPNHRPINWLLQALPVIASRFVTHTQIMSAAFSLIYILPPLLGCLMAWRLARQRAPGLMVWTVGWVL